MCGVCARRTRTARVGRGPSPRERERRRAITVGGIRLAREKEGSGRWDGDGDIVEAHIHMRARPPTLAQADAHWAVRLAHYRLPDSHHELLEKSIEYKKSPWCARRAEPSPLLHPRHFPSCSLSSSFSLLPFPSLFPSVSFQLCSASLSPTTPFLLLSPHLSRAHTRGICVRRCSR